MAFDEVAFDAQERVPLGRTNVAVTRLGFGTAEIGGLYHAVPDKDAEEVLEHAWSTGVRYFDTAPLYGYGNAERRLGAMLRDKPRDDFVVSTKVGRLLLPVGDIPADACVRVATLQALVPDAVGPMTLELTLESPGIKASASYESSIAPAQT